MSFEVTPHRFWYSFNTQFWEPETFEFYKKYTSPKKEVIDIGGWLGPTMLIAYGLNAKKITVVEADPANYYNLRKHVFKNFLDDRVELKNFCLSENTGDLVSFGCLIKGDSSTKAMNKGQTKVLTTSFLDFLKSCNLENTNIIKIDIEGAEQKITKSLDYIASFKDIIVLLSIHIPFWDEYESNASLLLKSFENFDVFDAHENALSKDQVTKVMTKKTEFFTLILKTR